MVRSTDTVRGSNNSSSVASPFRLSRAIRSTDVTIVTELLSERQREVTNHGSRTLPNQRSHHSGTADRKDRSKVAQIQIIQPAPMRSGITPISCGVVHDDKVGHLPTRRFLGRFSDSAQNTRGVLHDEV